MLFLGWQGIATFIGMVAAVLVIIYAFARVMD